MTHTPLSHHMTLVHSATRFAMLAMLSVIVAATPVVFVGQTAFANERQASERGVERSRANREKNRSATAEAHSATESTSPRTVESQQPEVAPQTPALTLNAVRLKKCEQQKASYSAKLQDITSRGQSQLQMLDKIAERTHEFYRQKSFSLTSYPTLTKEIDSRRSATEDAAKRTEQLVQSWSCNSDPYAALAAIKDAKEAELAALKDYKTATNNLIGAIKSVASQQEQQ